MNRLERAAQLRPSRVLRNASIVACRQYYERHDAGPANMAGFSTLENGFDMAKVDSRRSFHKADLRFIYHEKYQYVLRRQQSASRGYSLLPFSWCRRLVRKSNQALISCMPSLLICMLGAAEATFPLFSSSRKAHVKLHSATFAPFNSEQALRSSSVPSPVSFSYAACNPANVAFFGPIYQMLDMRMAYHERISIAALFLYICPIETSIARSNR